MTDSPRAARETIPAFLDSLSQRTPTPGGGGAAALSGALGAALAAMVARFSTRGEEQRSAGADEMALLAERLDETREALLGLMDDDARAYDAVSRACALPRDDAGRKEAIAAACAAACQPPLAVAQRAAEALRLLAERADGLNGNLASDVAISADLLLAAARAGERLTRVNAYFAGRAAAAALASSERAAKEAAAAHAQLIAAADASVRR